MKFQKAKPGAAKLVLPLHSSQPEAGHDGPADKPDEAVESDLHS